jgi:hypothetical protein
MSEKIYCVGSDLLGRLQAALKIAVFCVGQEEAKKTCIKASKELDALLPAAHATAADFAFNTGGNEMVDRLTLDDGKILEISEECVVLFPGEGSLNADPEEVQDFPGFPRGEPK